MTFFEKIASYATAVEASTETDGIIKIAEEKP